MHLHMLSIALLPGKKAEGVLHGAAKKVPLKHQLHIYKYTPDLMIKFVDVSDVLIKNMNLVMMKLIFQNT